MSEASLTLRVWLVHLVGLGYPFAFSTRVVAGLVSCGAVGHDIVRLRAFSCKLLKINATFNLAALARATLLMPWVPHVFEL